MFINLRTWKSMKPNRHRIVFLLTSVAGALLAFDPSTQAASTFSFQSRDLVLTFRKLNGNATTSYDYEINIGQASLYYNAAPGSTTPITQYTTDELMNYMSDVNNLQWSVGGCVPNVVDSGNASFPPNTLWVTIPRSDPTIPAPAPGENSGGSQAATSSQIKSILDNAVFYGGTVAADTDTNSANRILVTTASRHDAGEWLGTAGNYDGNFQVVENLTGSGFAFEGIVSRSDFYQLKPDNSGTFPSGKHLGYFELETDGSMNFVATSSAPTAPALTISNVGGTPSISFPTQNNVTYTLYYTAAAGHLTSPIHTWSTVSTNIIGNGSIQAFQAPVTDSATFYTVAAH